MFALSFYKSDTCIALKLFLSILTLAAVVCCPNKVIPLVFKCAAMWAGPVSLAITKELSLTNEDNCEISRALPLFKTQVALILLASTISEGPGAIIILNRFWNLFFY